MKEESNFIKYMRLFISLYILAHPLTMMVDGIMGMSGSSFNLLTFVFHSSIYVYSLLAVCGFMFIVCMLDFIISAKI